MPATRLFAQFKAQRAALLTLSAVFIVALVPLIATQNAAACPLVIPRTLRALYIDSDVIVVARVGETVMVEDTYNAESSYHTFTLRTVLHVSTTVKGESKLSTVDLLHFKWAQEGKLHLQDGHTLSQYSRDDKLLLFLRRESENSYVLTDYRYGIKQLSDSDLKVYLQRLDELDGIMRQQPVDNTRLAEWLVRCAEEPATMWEGVYDLVTSYRALNANNPRMLPSNQFQMAIADNTSSTQDSANGFLFVGGSNNAPIIESTMPNSAPIVTLSVVIPDGNTTAQSADTPQDNTATQSIDITDVPQSFTVGSNNAPGFFSLYNPDFARLLTAEQKNRLSMMLFNAKTITENESLLIDLVRKWDEGRLVPFIISYLHTVADDPPYMAEQMVRMVAELLKNQSLSKLAEYYSENALYNDEPEESSADVDEDEATATEDETATEETGEASANESVVEEKDESAKENEAEESLLSGTHTQKRSARLRRFLSVAESVMSQ